MEKDFYKELIKPFPAKALSKDASRGFDLTSVKAQWVVERLNEVFGIFGWEFEEEFEKAEEGVLCHGKLVVTNGERERTVTATGFAVVKKNLGDTYKSASTDSLSKCSSRIGIANDVFKGLHNGGGSAEKAGGKATMGQYYKAEAAITKAKSKSELKRLAVAINEKDWELGQIETLEKQIETKMGELNG